MPITVTKDEIIRSKRAVVVLSEINKIAISVLKQPDKLGPVREDLLTLIKLIRRLEEIATE